MGSQNCITNGLHTNRAEIFVFGPQCLSFGYEAAGNLRSQLLGDSKFSWALKELQNLSSYWNILVPAIPILQHLDGEKLLQSLTAWVQTGTGDLLVWPLPNIILTPLVVIMHLVEFQQTVIHSPQGKDCRTESDVLNGVSEILGLCTGLLSATAISCSKNRKQLREHGRVAIRLAMLVGAVVDAKDTSLPVPERASSLSVFWTHAGGYRELEKILDVFPAAYVSVFQNEHKVTVTTSQVTTDGLLHQLRQSSFAVVPLSLRGHFHWRDHEDSLKLIAAFCESNPDFNFKSELTLPIRSNETGLYMLPSRLHESIVQSMLVRQSNWHTAFTNMQASWNDKHDVPCVTCIGPERPEPMLDPSRDYVAVIGMACQLPGAADINQFWEILCRAESQHVEVPSERFNIDTAWRISEGKKWYGNFIEDHDAFDHRFFKKSPREAASTDPQHRLMLQVAYQAVEQSGYFTNAARETNIGCYVASGLSDYEENISHYPANAYSATGNLKAFAAGSISHYFGWTGPGLTVDTACSSSVVAINLACQSILSGESAAALVGGVNIMAGPDWFHNLAGASFLSPTGQCKPFDAGADGYCRGEAVGAVFLKRLSAAVRDNDQIFGVIAASAVQQNANCTAITVPNELSLTNLFRRVTFQAGVSSGDVSYAEAHGTGTAVGDPAEYDSIRRIFGGSARQRTGCLSLGSVKGLLGHAEAASGIVALLKILLMIHHSAIPSQASFHNINPALHAIPTDHIEISRAMQPWNAKFKIALINNYGASGSNASLLVAQPPPFSHKFSLSAIKVEKNNKCGYPFGIYASDERALRRYSLKLLELVRSNEAILPADISFQLARQSNRALRCLLSFSCDSISQLEQKLEGWDSAAITTIPSPRPIILCFGGQRATFVGLDRHVYNNSKIFRAHLDRCNSICEDLGTAIYPTIFQTAPMRDIVELHAALFSMQFACAQSWLDCMTGIQIAAVVGHSFGELSALCIAGAVSLEDMLKFVVGRARLIRDAWGPEKGSMLAVEADLSTVKKLLVESGTLYQGDHPASIACFNAPNSFTLAGSSGAINAVIEMSTIRRDFTSIKTKRLDVANAYHCSLADRILSRLEAESSSIRFHKPSIHIEIASETTEQLQDHTLLFNHLRRPVYFSQAVQRLARKFESAIWLEAGSNSMVTIMAGRALEGALSGISSQSHHFQPVNITEGALTHRLPDVTTALWRKGVNVKLWSHHHSQANNYRSTILPPYQFEKTKHWMERKEFQQTGSSPSVHPNTLWSFKEYRDSKKRSVRFRVNSDSEKFQSILQEHTIGQTPVCPSTLQLEIAIDALMSQRTDFADGTYQPQLLGMNSVAPMTLDARETWLEAHTTDSDALIWEWSMSSSVGTDGTARQSTLTFVTGKIVFYPLSEPNIMHEFAKLEQLARRERCLNLLDGSDTDDVIQGQRHIYKLFSDVVEYGNNFQGLQKLVGKGNEESAGRVVLTSANSEPGQPWLNFAIADCFCQVAGIFVNVMIERSHDEIYISNRIDQWIRSPRRQEGHPSVLEVYARHERLSDMEFVSNVFVFDPTNGAMMEVILGIHYQKTSRIAMSRALARMAGLTCKSGTITNLSPSPSKIADLRHAKDTQRRESTMERKKHFKSHSDISSQLRAVVASLSGLDMVEIGDTTQLADLGIDSLMGMELTREIETVFQCNVNSDLFFRLSDFQSLVLCVEKSLGISKPDNPQKPDIVEPRINVMKDSLKILSQGHYQNGILTPPLDRNLELGTRLPANVILQTFRKCKKAGVRFIRDSGLAGYSANILPKSDDLCIAYICDAFEHLGCSLRTVAPGEKLPAMEYLPRHERFVALLYRLLENKAGLVKENGLDGFVRTAVAAPTLSARSLLQDLNQMDPLFASTHNLTALTGDRLADCLIGKADGLQLIFGTPEGRDIASAMYGQSPINTAWIKQLEDFIRVLIPQLPSNESIKILEMGAGTGGTTSKIIPLLSSLERPVIYTVSDISSSLVATARKRFKKYSFVDYRVIDIESEPPRELLHTYHIVLATNCVHATRSIAHSTGNIRKMLRPDGFLLMLEMTESLAWVDLVFGLLDGWWAFEDGRKHALAGPEAWESILHEVGYGKIEWTDGDLPESKIQRLILAMAASQRYDKNTPSFAEMSHNGRCTNADGSDLEARKHTVDSYVQQYTAGFSLAPSDNLDLSGLKDGPVHNQLATVLVTGATGSLGSHIIQHFASLAHVGTVICLNRPSKVPAQSRQEQALCSKGISLNPQELSKLHVFQTEAHKPLLGLCLSDYHFLTHNVTHIIHNAWPMSIQMPTTAFESQFKAMRSLIQLAVDVHTCQKKFLAFGFVSSIGVVGLHHMPTATGQTPVPETSMAIESVLPNGYSDAKLICERMVAATLGRFPNAFNAAMSIRVGQIAGSRVTGYWNPKEHFAFMVKSSQTLRVLPDLRGSLSWCPVNDVAATLGDLLLSSANMDRNDTRLLGSRNEQTHRVYHVENPIRQDWKEMIKWLAIELDVHQVAPFEDWLARIRELSPTTVSGVANPAAKLIEFMEEHFIRMSCGNIVLSTKKSRAVSPALRNVRSVDKQLLSKYVRSWKEMKFLES